MIEADIAGQPIHCYGCGAPVERITPAMQHPVPAAVAWAAHGAGDLTYVACGPLPDGSRPCLARAILIDAVRVARLHAVALERSPARAIAAGVPVDIAARPVEAAGVAPVSTVGFTSAACANSLCRRAVLLSPRAEAFAAGQAGGCVRLCAPCAVVRFSDCGMPLHLGAENASWSAFAIW